MKKNLSAFESIVRMLVGFGLTFFLFLGGPLWTIGGLYLLLSGCLRFCFIKKLITG